jgi:hypothetical protein
LVAQIKAMFARFAGQANPSPTPKSKPSAAAEEVRVYNMLDERHRDYQDGLGGLAKLAGATFYHRVFGLEDTANPLLPDNISTLAYAADLLRQRGYTVDEESRERVGEVISKAPAVGHHPDREGHEATAGAPDRGPAKQTTGRSFSQLTALYLAHPDSKFSVIGVEQRQGTYRLFQSHIGDAPLPVRHPPRRERVQGGAGQPAPGLWPLLGKGVASLSFQELLQRFPAKGKGLSAITINRHLAALGALWKWARREGPLT